MSKPRHGARVDLVHPAIVTTLEDAGARVLVLDVSAEGEPDLLVGWLGTLHLLELKTPKIGRLSKGQKDCHAAWARVGIRVHTAKTPKEALDAIGITGEAAVQRQRDLGTLGDALRTTHVGHGVMRPAVRRPT